MYNPIFSYTDKLVSSLIKLEANKTSLQNIDLSYEIKSKLAQKSKALDIFHLAHLLNLEITLKDADRIFQGHRPENIDEIRRSILLNYKNVIDFNRSSLADTYAEMDGSVLKHLNKLVITQWRENWDARFRSLNDSIDDRWDSFVEFRDPHIQSNQIEGEVNELVDWYSYSLSTVTPIIRIGVGVFRMIEISPYLAANKITIIGLLDYLLLKQGMSSKIYLSTLKFIENNEKKLLAAFDLSRRSHDLSVWLENFTEGLVRELIQAREDIDAFIIQDEKSRKQPFLDLNKRQLKVLKYLQTVPTIKREDYCHMMEVSTMTAFRDLRDLVRKKLVKTDGQGRGTRYKLASM